MLDQALGDESTGERNEASNVGTADIVTGGAVLFGGLPAPAVDVPAKGRRRNRRVRKRSHRASIAASGARQAG